MLKVSETFLSVQGEGLSMGKPAIFLRLAGCNLNCKGFAGGCDTIAVWKRGMQWSKEALFNYWVVRGWLKYTNRIVITGGEPLLQAKGLIEFIDFINGQRTIMGPEGLLFKIYWELETNGTKWNYDLIKRINQINISPKLHSSGTTVLKRYNMEVLNEYARLRNRWLAIYSCWKFVIQSAGDTREVQDKFEKPFLLSRDSIWLMPAGVDSERLNKVAKWLAPYCARKGYNYSDRLQIRIWGKKQGV